MELINLYFLGRSELMKFFAAWKAAIGKPVGAYPEKFSQRFLDLVEFQALLESYDQHSLTSEELEIKLLWTHGECVWVAVALKTWLQRKFGIQTRTMSYESPFHVFLEAEGGVRMDGITIVQPNAPHQLYRHSPTGVVSLTQETVEEWLSFDFQSSLMYYTWCEHQKLEPIYELNHRPWPMTSGDLDEMTRLLQARKTLLQAK